MLLKEMPLAEQPVYRVRHMGAGAVSAVELLTIILGSGSTALAEELVVKYGDLARLTQVSMGELCQLKGVGPKRAATIKAAIELGKRVFSGESAVLPKITSPQDVARLVGPDMGHLEQEELRVLLLNTRNDVTDMIKLYKGNANTVVCRMAEIFKAAVRQNAVAIILVHNHPSGDPTPSPEDIQLTQTVRESGKLLDVELLDHVIVGHSSFVSLRERGLGFEMKVF